MTRQDVGNWLQGPYYIQKNKIIKVHELPCTKYYSCYCNKISYPGDFPGGPVIKNPASSAGDIVSLVRKLRPHMRWGNQAQAPQATTKQAQSGVHMPQPERSLPLQQKIPHATTRPNAAQKMRENFK